ncbi:MAG: hypothetical protein PHS79_00455 [Patescibacteria group bacterium]|nr:hypothetical protein [Patescibacteria group bacterium]
MFDTAPPNLPVEPTSQPSRVPTVPRPAGEDPPTPKPVAATANNRSGIKEPEDIFADIQEPDGSRVSNIGSRNSNPESRTPNSAGAPSSGGFPMKIVFGIGIPLVVLGLGIGGWYVYKSYTSSNNTISPPVQQNAQGNVPVTNAPDNTPAETNPIPKPDETQMAASQASLALMQAQAAKGYNGEGLLGVTSTDVLDANQPSTTIDSFIDQANQPTATPTITAPPNVPLPGTEVKPSPTTIGVDSDVDGFTNSEEALLGTDPNSIDSDGDGFGDLNEIASGYDPASRGGKLNVSASLKTEAIGSLDVYVPAAWERKPGSGGSVQILTGTPAVMTVDMLPYSGASLLAWVMYQDTANVADGYLQAKTAAGNDVVYSNDEMTAWLLVGDTVYRFKYDASGAQTKDFGTIFKQIIVNQAGM